MSDPEGPPGKMFLLFDVEACWKLLDVRCEVEPPIWELEQDVPWLDGVRGDTLTVESGGYFPLSGEQEFEVSLLRQGIAEK